MVDLNAQGYRATETSTTWPAEFMVCLQHRYLSAEKLADKFFKVSNAVFLIATLYLDSSSSSWSG